MGVEVQSDGGEVWSDREGDAVRWGKCSQVGEVWSDGGRCSQMGWGGAFRNFLKETLTARHCHLTSLIIQPTLFQHRQ